MPRQKQSNPKPLKLQREEIKQLIKDGSSSHQPKSDESLEMPAAKKKHHHHHHHHKHHHSKKKKQAKYKDVMKVKIADKVRNKRQAKALREKQVGKKKKKKKEMEMDDLSGISNNNNNQNKSIVGLHVNQEVSNLIDTLSPDLESMSQNKYDLIKERSHRLQQAKKDKEKDTSGSPVKKVPEKITRRTVSEPGLAIKQMSPVKRTLILQDLKENQEVKHVSDALSEMRHVRAVSDMVPKVDNPVISTKEISSSDEEEDSLSKKQALEALLQITGDELNTMTKSQPPVPAKPVTTLPQAPVVTPPAAKVTTSSPHQPGGNIVKITETETGMVKYQLRNESLEEQGLALVYTAQTTGQADSDVLYSTYKPRKSGKSPTDPEGKEGRSKKPGRHVCQFCGRRCTKPSVLKKHIRSHTGERPYPCVPCGFWFKTKSNLYKHCKSHAHAIKAGLTPNSEDMGKVDFDEDNDSEETESEDEGQICIPGGMTPTSPCPVAPITGGGSGDSNIPRSESNQFNAAQLGGGGDAAATIPPKVKIERSELRQRLERRISLNALNESTVKEIQLAQQHQSKSSNTLIPQQYRPTLTGIKIKEEVPPSPIVQASFALPAEITKTSEDVVMSASGPGTSDVLKSLLPAEVAGFRIDMETKRAVPVLSNQLSTTHCGPMLAATSTTLIPSSTTQPHHAGAPGQLMIPVTGFNIVKSRGQFHVQIPVQGVPDETMRDSIKPGVMTVQNMADMTPVAKPVSKESVQERIQQLITQNEAIVDKATLDSVKPRRTGIYRRDSTNLSDRRDSTSLSDRRDSTSTPPRLENAAGEPATGEPQPVTAGRDMPTLIKEGTNNIPAALLQQQGTMISGELPRKVETLKNDNESKISSQTLPVTVTQSPMPMEGGNLLERVLKAPRTSQMPDLAPIAAGFPVTGFPGPMSGGPLSGDRQPRAVTPNELAMRVASSSHFTYPTGQYHGRRSSESSVYSSGSSNTIKNLLQDKKYRSSMQHQQQQQQLQQQHQHQQQQHHQQLVHQQAAAGNDKEAQQYTHMLQLQAALQGKIPMSPLSNSQMQLPGHGTTVFVPGGPPGGIYPPQAYRGYPTAEDVKAENRMIKMRRKYKSESEALSPSVSPPPKRRGRKPTKMPELALINDSNADIPEENTSGFIPPLRSPHVQLTNPNMLPFAVQGLPLQQQLHLQQLQHQQLQHQQLQHQQLQQKQHQQVPVGLLQTVPQSAAYTSDKKPPASEVSVIQHTNVTPNQSKPSITPLRIDPQQFPPRQTTPVLPWQPGLATQYLGHQMLPGSMSLHQQYSPQPSRSPQPNRLMSPRHFQSTSPNFPLPSPLASPHLTTSANMNIQQTSPHLTKSGNMNIQQTSPHLTKSANMNIQQTSPHLTKSANMNIQQTSPHLTKSAHLNIQQTSPHLTKSANMNIQQTSPHLTKSVSPNVPLASPHLLKSASSQMSPRLFKSASPHIPQALPSPLASPSPRPPSSSTTPAPCSNLETATTSECIPTAMQILAAVANHSFQAQSTASLPTQTMTVQSTSSAGSVPSTGSNFNFPPAAHRQSSSPHVPLPGPPGGNLSIPSVHVRRPSLHDNTPVGAPSQPSPLLNSPRLNSPRLNSPRLNSPRLNSPRLNSPLQRFPQLNPVEDNHNLLRRSPQQKRMLEGGPLMIDETPRLEESLRNRDGASPKRPKLELPPTSVFQPGRKPPLKRPGSLGPMSRGHLTLDIPSPLTHSVLKSPKDVKPQLRIDPKSLLTPEALSIASSVMRLASPIKSNTPSTPVDAARELGRLMAHAFHNAGGKVESLLTTTQGQVVLGPIATPTSTGGSKQIFLLPSPSTPQAPSSIGSARSPKSPRTPLAPFPSKDTLSLFSPKEGARTLLSPFPSKDTPKTPMAPFPSKDTLKAQLTPFLSKETPMSPLAFFPSKDTPKTPSASFPSKEIPRTPLAPFPSKDTKPPFASYVSQDMPRTPLTLVPTNDTKPALALFPSKDTPKPPLASYLSQDMPRTPLTPFPTNDTKPALASFTSKDIPKPTLASFLSQDMPRTPLTPFPTNDTKPPLAFFPSKEMPKTPLDSFPSKDTKPPAIQHRPRTTQPMARITPQRLQAIFGATLSDDRLCGMIKINTPMRVSRAPLQSLQYASSSTRNQLLTQGTYCCLRRSQPMYVQQGSNMKISMYSNWKAGGNNQHPLGMSWKAHMGLYNSSRNKKPRLFFILSDISPPKSGIVTQSGAWKPEQMTLKVEPPTTPLPHNHDDSESTSDISATSQLEQKTKEKKPKDHHYRKHDGHRIPIFKGGFKSNEDYEYVRGRGRGKYVCEECGIRCKKPSMLKKHIRTHTDMRPYQCSICNFAFKTKGNLTKHMKSKAHNKKCLENGITPGEGDLDQSFEDGDDPIHQFSDADEEDTDSADGDSDSDDESELGTPISMFPLSRERRRSVPNLSELSSDGRAVITQPASAGPLKRSFSEIFERPRRNSMPAGSIAFASEQERERLDSLIGELQNRTDDDESMDGGSVIDGEKPMKLSRSEVVGKLSRHLTNRHQAQRAAAAASGKDQPVTFDMSQLPQLHPGLLFPSTQPMNVQYATSHGVNNKANVNKSIGMTPQGPPVLDKLGHILAPTVTMSSGYRLSTTIHSSAETNTASVPDKSEASTMSSLPATTAPVTVGAYIGTMVDPNTSAATPMFQQDVKSSTANRPTAPISIQTSPGVNDPHRAVMGHFGVPGFPSSSAAVSHELPSSAAVATASSAPSACSIPRPQHLAINPTSPDRLFNYAAIHQGGLHPAPRPQPYERQESRERPDGNSFTASLAHSAYMQGRVTMPTPFSAQPLLTPLHLPPGTFHRDGSPRKVPPPVVEPISDDEDEHSAKRRRLMHTDKPPHLNTPSSRSWDPQPGNAIKQLLLQRPQMWPGGPELHTPQSPFSSPFLPPSPSVTSAKMIPGPVAAYSSSHHGRPPLVSPMLPSNLSQLPATILSQIRSPTHLKFPTHLPPMNSPRATPPSENAAAFIPPVARAKTPSEQRPQLSPKGKPHSPAVVETLEEEVCTSPTPGGNHKCPTCSKVFMKPNQLRIHMRTHPEEQEQTFQCHECELEFRNRNQLAKHERSEQHLSNIEAVELPMEGDTDPRPFKCKLCQIAFRIRGHLAKHLRSRGHIASLEREGSHSLGKHDLMIVESMSDDPDTEDGEPHSPASSDKTDSASECGDIDNEESPMSSSASSVMTSAVPS